MLPFLACPILIARINRTNCQTVVEGQTLTELIAQKDALSLKLHVYRDVVYAGSQISYRARNTEIKIRSAFSVADWQKEIRPDVQRTAPAG